MYLCTVLADKFRPCHSWECPNPSRRTVCKNVSLRFVDEENNSWLLPAIQGHGQIARIPIGVCHCISQTFIPAFKPPRLGQIFWIAEITFDPVKVETRNNDQTASNEFGNGCRDLKTCSKTAEGKEVHPRDEHLNLSKWCPKFYQKLLWQNWIIYAISATLMKRIKRSLRTKSHQHNSAMPKHFCAIGARAGSTSYDWRRPKF